MDDKLKQAMKEADEISWDDLQAGAEFYDKLKKDEEAEK